MKDIISKCWGSETGNLNLLRFGEKAKNGRKLFTVKERSTSQPPWGLPVAFNLSRPSDAHPPPVVRPVTPDPQFAGPAGKACPR